MGSRLYVKQLLKEIYNVLKSYSATRLHWKNPQLSQKLPSLPSNLPQGNYIKIRKFLRKFLENQEYKICSKNFCLNFDFRNGHYDIAKLLLDNGANVNGSDPFSTPIDLAIEKGHDTIVQLLLERNTTITNYMLFSVISLLSDDLTLIYKPEFVSKINKKSIFLVKLNFIGKVNVKNETELSDLLLNKILPKYKRIAMLLVNKGLYMDEFASDLELRKLEYLLS